MIKPLLLLDVDGPLNVYKCLTEDSFVEPKILENCNPYEWEVVKAFPEGFSQGLRLLLSRDMSSELKKLEEVYTLIWATTWREEANKWIAPFFDLGALPVISFPKGESERAWSFKENHRGSWKIKHIAQLLDEYAWYSTSEGELKRIPWVFVDDEITGYDRAWLRTHWSEKDNTFGAKVAPRWLLQINPGRGLTSEDFRELYDWGVRNNSAERAV